MERQAEANRKPGRHRCRVISVRKQARSRSMASAYRIRHRCPAMEG